MGRGRLGHRVARRGVRRAAGRTRSGGGSSATCWPARSSRYARAVRADQESYISLDEGLSVISKHAKERARLRRDRAAARRARALAGRLHRRPRRRSAARRRRSPSSSSPPSTSGPRRSSASSRASATCATWSARTPPARRSPACSTRSSTGTAGSTSIRLDDRNLPAIVHERLLKPKDDARTRRARRRVQPGRQRPAAGLGDPARHPRRRGRPGRVPPHLPVQPRVPARDGGHLRRAAARAHRAQAHAAAARRLPRHAAGRPAHAARRDLRRPRQRRRPAVHRQAPRRVRAGQALLHRSGCARTCCTKHRLTEEQAPGSAHGTRSAPTTWSSRRCCWPRWCRTSPRCAASPRPAWPRSTTARSSRMLPNQERAAGRRRRSSDLSAQFGEIRLSGSEDDPRVDLALIGVDTEGDHPRQAGTPTTTRPGRRLVRDLLWAELGLKDRGSIRSPRTRWSGAAPQRRVEVLMDNVRDRDRMPTQEFQADPGTIRVVIDYPFDEGNRIPRRGRPPGPRAAGPARAARTR